MAKKRRSAAQKAATRKMIAANKRKGRGGGHAKRKKRHAPAARVARRRRRRGGGNVGLVMVPSGRRKVTVTARRFNPGGSIGAALKSVVSVGVPAVLAGGTFGLIDARVLSKYSDPIRYGGKVAYSLLLGILFRKNPILSAATMGGVLGSFGSDLAAKLGGGTAAAPNSTAAVKGIGALLREDTQAMGLLIQEMRGMGLNVDNNVSLGAVGVGEDMERYDDVNLG